MQIEFSSVQLWWLRNGIGPSILSVAAPYDKCPFLKLLATDGQCDA